MRPERQSLPPRAETPRDIEESGFTPILRQLTETISEIEVAIFVDDEGECIDYSARIGLFDARVAGAQLHVLTHSLAAHGHRSIGLPFAYHIVAERSEIIVRRVSDEYTLVLLCDPPAPLALIGQVLEGVVQDLRGEAGIATPAWEPRTEALAVELRQAIGWGYAPWAFTEGGTRHELSAVMGRWVDADADGSVCFLVRLDSGEESVLVHDARAGRWSRRPGR